jgi:hypothetical protein
LIDKSRLVREVANLAPNFADYGKAVSIASVSCIILVKCLLLSETRAKRNPIWLLDLSGTATLTVVGKAA